MDKTNIPKTNFSHLKSAEVKELISKLEEWYKCDTSFLNNYYFYIASKDKIYISTINLEKIKINRIQGIGIYFGTMHDNKRFRLSIEGSQLIKPQINYVKINKETCKSYLSAENLFKEETEEINWQNNCPFLIIKYDKYNLGCVSIKGDELLTYMPKSRKLDFNKVF